MAKRDPAWTLGWCALLILTALPGPLRACEQGHDWLPARAVTRPAQSERAVEALVDSLVEGAGLSGHTFSRGDAWAISAADAWTVAALVRALARKGQVAIAPRDVASAIAPMRIGGGGVLTGAAMERLVIKKRVKVFLRVKVLDATQSVSLFTDAMPGRVGLMRVFGVETVVARVALQTVDGRYLCIGEMKGQISDGWMYRGHDQAGSVDSLYEYSLIRPGLAPFEYRDPSLSEHLNQ